MDKLQFVYTSDCVPVVHARWHGLKDGTEECTNCLGLCPHEENYNGDVIFNFGCERTKWLNEVTMAWHRYMKARAWNLPKEG